MNILEIEDMIKGLPDQALQREAQMPSCQVPQFLVVSEIQRRGDMRKRFSERQPQGTVKDQVIQEGIAAMAPPEPQMQSAMMGMQQPMPQAMPPQMQMQQPQMAPPMQMAEGRVTPFPNDPRLAELRAQGLTDEQIAQEIRSCCAIGERCYDTDERLIRNELSRDWMIRSAQQIRDRFGLAPAPGYSEYEESDEALGSRCDMESV